jgi:hypothetical protein
MISDPLRAPLLPAIHATPGMRVLHRRGQWLATVVRREPPWIWVRYDDDAQRGRPYPRRLHEADVVRYGDVQCPPQDTQETSDAPTP